ncbi:MAG: peptidase [Flaviaesturariibacter sp.]|nr:peptidase [Flaviaesturariibacter sp.]
MKKLLLIAAGISFAVAATAQTEDSLFIRRLADEVLNNSKAYENLRQLTKGIGGRLAGSPQMAKAEQWGLKAMQAARPDRAWLQECMVPHWVRGGRDLLQAERLVSSDAKNRKWSTRYLDVLALGNSVGTSGPLRAQIMEVSNFDDLEAMKDSVKGKIVFYNYKFKNTFIKTFQSYGDAVVYRGQGPSRAAKYGAKAVIVRSMSHSTDNNPHTGSTGYTDSTQKIPAVAIGLRDADWLDSTLRSNTTVFATMTTGGHFLPDTIGHNVIGELKGSQFPNQYITIGGHLDSWDPAEGAHDDGAGVVQTIEVLRALKALGYQPKHSIRFVLFANEENGTRGGRKYAEEAKAKGEQHIFALESDEGGFTPRGFGLTGSEAQYQKMLGWKELLSPYGASEIVRGGGGSDISPLGRELNTPLCGFIPDSQRYFDYHHARNDIFENVNKRELELGALNIAALIYLVDKYGL